MKNLKIMICRYPGYSKKNLVEIQKEAKSLKYSHFFKYKMIQKFDFAPCDTSTTKKYFEVMKMIFGVLDKHTTK